MARLSLVLERALRDRDAPGRPVVFACIGTDRSTGDALGPLVGQRLLQLGYERTNVLGTLQAPLHAINMAERLAAEHLPDEALVVAIDAALGPLDGVGGVSLRAGGLDPGKGVGKRLPRVGELALTGTVNVQAGALDSQVLQSTRLYLVQQMAEMMGSACWWATRGLVSAGDLAQERAIAGPS